jgi:hypothetical protein
VGQGFDDLLFRRTLIRTSAWSVFVSILLRLDGVLGNASPCVSNMMGGKTRMVSRLVYRFVEDHETLRLNNSPTILISTVVISVHCDEDKVNEHARLKTLRRYSTYREAEVNIFTLSAAPVP